MNIKSDIKKYFSWAGICGYITLFIIPVSIIFWEIALKLTSEITGFDYHIFGIIFYAIGLGFLINAIAFAFTNRKVTRWIIGVFLEIFALWFTINYFINESYTTFMNIKDIIQGAGDVVGDFKDTLISLVVNGVWYILLYQVPFILYIIFKNKLFYDFNTKKVYAFLIIGAVFFSSSIGFQYIKPVDRDKMGSSYGFDQSIRTFGLLQATKTDFRYMLIGQNSSIEIEEEEEEEPIEIVYERNVLKIPFNTLIEDTSNSSLKDVYSYLMTQKGDFQNEYTGLFKGKNLIIITAESFAKELIDEQRTPALYRLANKGILFNDYYQPAWGGSTSTGEFSILTGIIPTSYVGSMKDSRDKNMWTTIGSLLREQRSYSTIGYHNNTYTYYDRHLTHKNLGLSDWIGMGNGMEKGVDWTWPESDLEMFQYTYPQYKNNAPYMTYYISVSGHPNYNFDGNYMSRKNEDKVSSLPYSDVLKAYIACNLELEYALEYLLDELEKDGTLNDTVICLSADHYPYGLCSDVWQSAGNTLHELYNYDGPIDEIMRDHNSLIIWSGCLEEMDPIIIDEPVYSLDILPTLCNLFGLQYDSRLYVGRDIFSDSEPLVIWNDHSFMTKYGYYDSDTGEFTEYDLSKYNVYDEETGELISYVSPPEDINAYVQKMKRTVNNKFALSRAVLGTSLYDNIKNVVTIEPEVIEETIDLEYQDEVISDDTDINNN